MTRNDDPRNDLPPTLVGGVLPILLLANLVICALVMSVAHDAIWLMMLFPLLHFFGMLYTRQHLRQKYPEFYTRKDDSDV